MSILAIKSTLEVNPIRWSVNFDDYDCDDYDEIGDWLEEQHSALQQLIEEHPKAGFVVNFEAEEDSLVREFYREYLGDSEVGSTRFLDAMDVFAKLANWQDNGLHDMFLALYYSREHDSDEYSVMNFVEQDNSHGCVISTNVDEIAAAKAHLQYATNHMLTALLEVKGILVEAADAFNDGKMKIGPHIGYAHWPDPDEEY